MTADHLSAEPTTITADTTDPLSVTTTIASKGGGQTKVQMMISRADLTRLIAGYVEDNGFDGLATILAGIDAGVAAWRADTARALNDAVAQLARTDNELHRAYSLSSSAQPASGWEPKVGELAEAVSDAWVGHSADLLDATIEVLGLVRPASGPQ